MKKKVTLRDIAEEAGVSVATVSYILNNRDDQCISEATRKKVLQIVNLYGYKINFHAKSISSGKTNIVGLYLGHGALALKRADHFLLIRRLAKSLKDKGLSLRVIDNTETSRLDWCDAVICCDAEESFFKTVSEANYCPVIAFDMLYDDQLFCQINSNYGKIKGIANEIFDGADYTVICHEQKNEALRTELDATFEKIVYVASFEDVNSITDKNNVVIGEMLCQYCKSINKDALSIDISSYEKIEKLIECLEITIARSGDVPHDIRI